MKSSAGNIRTEPQGVHPDITPPTPIHAWYAQCTVVVVTGYATATGVRGVFRPALPARSCSDFLLRDLFRLAQAFTGLLAMLDERMPDRADSRVMVKAACGGFGKGNIAFQIFITQRPVGVQE